MVSKRPSRANADIVHCLLLLSRVVLSRKQALEQEFQAVREIFKSDIHHHVVGGKGGEEGH